MRHNAYFVDFPDNVPDTQEFWARCIAEALMDPRSAANVAGQLASGRINLLDLPRYGRYQHTYEELLAAHDELITSARDRVTVLHLGGPLTQESHGLYLMLAASSVPLSEADLGLLSALAELHLTDPQPDQIGIRENRAVINRVRLGHDLPLLVDTPVDVLRLACAISEGDVTLSAPTRLRSLRRAERRALLSALDQVVDASPAKLSDVARFAEPFKRLGERLHPHEYPQWPRAQAVFAVARGELEARSLASRVELAFAAGRPDEAVAVLANAPGMLVRSVDRLARSGAEIRVLNDALRDAAPAVSTRVLLSLREHLLNRQKPATVRIFVNQQGRSWVTSDDREPLPHSTTATLGEALDEALARRLPRIARLVVDPAIRLLAVPLSAKTRPGGFGIVPRGSVVPLGRHLRFFVHWKEREYRTDFDLSVLLLDDDFMEAGQVSWTNLRGDGVVHSGDITEAPSGASEFIDLDLYGVAERYVVPQVHIYDGEGFDQVEEAFFGFMQRDTGQRGRPFEPRTVRVKTDLFGAGRVALPVVFARADNGDWHAKWMHLTLSGYPQFNRVEVNRISTSLLVRGVVEREYLRMSYVEDLVSRNGAAVEPGAPTSTSTSRSRTSGSTAQNGCRPALPSSRLPIWPSC